MSEQPKMLSEQESATETMIGQPMRQAVREAAGVVNVVCIVTYHDGSQKVMAANLDDDERKAKKERESQ